jgi:hypothetical protein
MPTQRDGGKRESRAARPTACLDASPKTKVSTETVFRLNGFVQRLTAHRPTIKVKHTNRGNWLTGIKIDGYEPGAGKTDSLRAPVKGLISLRRSFWTKGEGVSGKSPSFLH